MIAQALRPGLLISSRFAANPKTSWANFFTASRYRSRPRL
jgi:hypothetical protein